MQSRWKRSSHEKQYEKFIVGRTDSELKGGMFNFLYLIDRINENDKIVLKVGVAPETTLLTYEQDIMLTEVECFRLISEQTDISVPRILAYDFINNVLVNCFFLCYLSI